MRQQSTRNIKEQERLEELRRRHTLMQNLAISVSVATTGATIQVSPLLFTPPMTLEYTSITSTKTTATRDPSRIDDTDSHLQQRRQQIAALSMIGTPPEPEGDWRSTVGMFDNDPIAREISEEVRRIRTNQRSG